jgi:hypothetical protein
MLSVVIIARNEERLIKGCLESVKWADEIVVIDNGSTDKTLSIVNNYTERIYKTSANNFSEIRNMAINKVKGEWLLFVDADERVLKGLREEIQELISGSPNENAWAISRRNIVLGSEVRYAAFWPDYVIRLFKTHKLKGYRGDIHEQPQYEGELGYLKSSFLHLTHRDIDSMVLKSLSWANIDARLRFQAHHPKMNGLRFLRIILTEIWNQGVIRRGFFNGTVGTIDSLVQVFSMFLSYAKLWQLQRSEDLDQSYSKIDKELERSNFQYK